MIKNFFRTQNKQAPNPENTEKLKLIAEIRDVIGQMDAVNGLFNMTSDHDMIERYIHELRALETYYAFLLKQVRTSELRCPGELVIHDREGVHS